MPIFLILSRGTMRAMKPEYLCPLLEKLPVFENYQR
jgi:hypothetical protein